MRARIVATVIVLLTLTAFRASAQSCGGYVTANLNGTVLSITGEVSGNACGLAGAFVEIDPGQPYPPHWTPCGGGVPTPCIFSIQFDIGCMVGTHTVALFPDCAAINPQDPNSCIHVGNPSPFTASFTIPDGMPTVSVGVTKSPSGEQTATVSYTFPDSSAGRSIALYRQDNDPKGNKKLALIRTWDSGLTTSGTAGPLTVNGCGELVAVATTCNSDQQGRGTAQLDPKGCPDNLTSCCSNPNSFGHPVNAGSGDVSYSIPLFSIDEPTTPLALTLSYHSDNPLYPSLSNPMGMGWHHSFGETLIATDPNGTYLYQMTAAGQDRVFVQTTAGNWVGMRPPSLTDTVTLVGSEYQQKDTNGTIKAFDVTTGRWLSTTDRWGNVTSAQYDGSGNLTAVTDPLGRQITVVASGTALQQVILPGGATWQFFYSSAGNLSQIYDPLHTTTAWRTIDYVDDGNGSPSLLAHVYDDSGAVIEGHDYYPDGRAKTSYVGANLDLITASYDTPSPGSTQTTETVDSLTTRTATFGLSIIEGAYYPTQFSGACSSCNIAPGEARVYDTLGRVSQKTDANQRITKYGYDSFGNTLSVTEAFGTSLERGNAYEYDDPTWPAFRTKETVPGPYGNRITTRSWDPGTMTITESTSGELGSTGPLATYTTTAVFDARHRLTSTDGPRTDVSDVTTRDYYPDNDADINRRGRLRTITNAAGLTTTYDNYDVYGTARLITDPNGVQTMVETDARGRTTAVVSQPVSGDPNESIAYRRTTTYDSRDRVMQTVSPNGYATGYSYEDGSNRLTDTIRYDASGNQVERLHLTLNVPGWKVAEEWQACGSPAPVCSTWVTKRSESYTYTDQGQLQSVVHPDATRRTFTYDSLLRVSTVQDEDHASANTTYAYDLLSRLRTVTQVLGTAPGGTINTTYAYNVQDQLTSVIDPNGNATNYEYDDFGRLSKQTSPVTGATTYGYDPAGNLLTTTDANSATTTRTYDAVNRALTATATRAGTPTESIAWSYDAPAGYGKGRLTSTSDPAGSTSYEYDRRGLLRRETKTIEGNTYVSAYAYDADGNRTGVTTPSGRTIAYTFDFAGRPASATTGGVALASGAAYMPFGPLTGLNYGNGTSLVRTYDDQYRILTNKLSQGATTIAEYDYGYDAAGNITTINDSTDATYNRSFGYDDLNRLITANSGTSLWGNGSYAYDSMGNMLSLHIGERTASFAYSGNTPKLTNVADTGTNSAVSYDAAGNEGSAGSSLYSYTSRNSLATNDSFTYTYDARGVRTISTTMGTGVTVVAVAISPSSVPGGDTATGTVTLSNPAPSSGATVALIADDQRVIQVPATVFVAPGASSATFTAATLRPIPAALTVTVRAFHQGSTATTNVTVSRVPRVTGLTLTPPSVTGGNNATATVSIDIPVGADTVLTLASTDTTVAPVPASVTVPAGNTTATFNIATTSVQDDTSVTISANYRGSAAGVLAVTAIPVTVSALSVVPVNVAGGHINATGTVTLNRNTGVNGAVINLASSNTNLATVPSTVMIPSGAAAGSFLVSTYTSTAATPVTISATYGTTQSATLTVASCTDWTPGAAILGSETIWVDDAVPAGSRSVTGTWTWDTTKMASGTQSHVTLTTGTDEHKFDNYPNYFHFNIGDQVVQYVLIDPCNPPAEIMLQFGQCCDGWFHRAFWGQDLLQYDQLGNGRIYMGPIPTGGQWIKLTAPASQMGMSGSRRGDVYGVAYDVAGGGHVWFDRTGKQSCTVPVAPAPPSLPSTDVVWFDDAPPTGASLSGAWTWVTTQKASGTKSHNDPTDMNFHQHSFQGSTQTVTPGVGDSLVTYVLIDPCDPPNEIQLQWYDGSSWNHRAYWGPNANNCGSEGPACHSMGALPALGTWLRLVVPASAVGLESHTLTGMAFGTYNGHAWFDRAGIQPAGSGKLVRPRASAPLIAERPSLIHRILARWRREPNAFGFGASAQFIAQPTMSGPTRQYSFYTPELQLLSETVLTDAPTPPIANDYIWFGGEPLAQIASTGDVAYDFNDHLGAPLLQTTATGTVVWRAERDPYGNRTTIRTGGGRHQPLGLPGQEVSDASDLKYNIMRWYRSGWGRYTQRDPLGLTGGMNQFAYAKEDPLFLFDRTGTVTVSIGPTLIDPSDNIKVDCGGFMTAMGYGSDVHGCTGVRGLSIKCKCNCNKDDHSYSPSISITATAIQMYYEKGGSYYTNWANFYDFSRPISESLIISEEMKHVRDLRARFHMLGERGGTFEKERYSGPAECLTACDDWVARAYKFMDESQAAVHRSNPHPY